MKARVYSTPPPCPFCKMTKNFLKGAGVEFEDIDVSKDQYAAKEVIKKSGKIPRKLGVPGEGSKALLGIDDYLNRRGE